MFDSSALNTEYLSVEYTVTGTKRRPGGVPGATSLIDACVILYNPRTYAERDMST